MKKVLAIILSVIMLLSVVPLTASAFTYSGKCGDNLTWSYDTLTYTLTISGTGAMCDYDYNNRPWESFEDNIKTIVINNDVTTIGNYAFYFCLSLVNVTIPDTVITIGSHAFYACDGLTSLIIPDGVTTIGEWAFSCCYNLESVYFPDSVTKIDIGAFAGCLNLREVILPNSISIIYNAVFYECESLESVTIPDSVTSIYYNAFEHCDSLSNVYYVGTEEQWENIDIYSGNDKLLLLKIHFGNYEHVFSEWIVETPQTCTEKGIEKRVCLECQKVEEREISATGHNYEIVATAPTCTERGFTTYTCHCGDSYVDNYVDATGHKYNSVVTQPTCEQNGYTNCTCECGDSYIANMISPTGHADKDKDGYCDICDELLCDHDCHRGGFAGFFWQITLFFIKLFRSNQYCECGIAHY